MKKTVTLLFGMLLTSLSFADCGVAKAKITYPGVHLFAVADLELFRETFGDALITRALNGTSLKVSFQRVVRDFVAISRDNLRNHEEQELRQAKFLLGERNSGERLPFVAIDGSRHATLADAKAASIASLES
jgi:hypothetical protein